MDVLEVIDNANRTGDSSLELPYDEGRETELKAVITLLVSNRRENKAKLSPFLLEMHELLVCAGRGGKFTAFLDEIQFSRTTAYRWIEEERNRTVRNDSSDSEPEYGLDDDEDEDVEVPETEDTDKTDESNKPLSAKNFTLRLPADTHRVFLIWVAALLARRGENANRATLLLELVNAAYETEVMKVSA
jgi:hypothetical protein